MIEPREVPPTAVECSPAEVEALLEWYSFFGAMERLRTDERLCQKLARLPRTGMSFTRTEAAHLVFWFFRIPGTARDTSDEALFVRLMSFVNRVPCEGSP